MIDMHNRYKIRQGHCSVILQSKALIMQLMLCKWTSVPRQPQQVEATVTQRWINGMTKQGGKHLREHFMFILYIASMRALGCDHLSCHVH